MTRDEVEKEYRKAIAEICEMTGLEEKEVEEALNESKDTYDLMKKASEIIKDE